MRLDNLQDHLADAIERHHIAGASIAIFANGQLTTAAAGVTNITTGVEVTQDTVMHIGSIAKIFTTTLIMQLVDEGHVGLDDLILHHLPELKLKDINALQKITIKMLLNHTSGIDGELLPEQGHDEETIEKGIVRFAELGQIFAPGANTSYCNAGFVILGYMAQRITGKSWYDLIKEKIYQPLDMQYAIALPEEALLHRASVGHHFDQVTKTQVRTSFSLLPLSFSPGGTTLMMSATDLVTFARTHINDGIGPNGIRILSETSAKLMRETTSCHYMDTLSLGLGWMTQGSGTIEHGGGAPGIISWVAVHPENKTVVVVLTNSGEGKVLINEFIRPWFNDFGKIGMPELEGNDVTLDPDRYTGIYEDVLTQYKVSAVNGRLMLSSKERFSVSDISNLNHSDPIPLLQASKDKFLLAPPDVKPQRPFGFLFSEEGAAAQYLGTSSRLYRRVSSAP